MTDYDVQPLLDRFNPPWPASLDIGEGWYPLVIELDATLAKIEPDYRLIQVKSKFGILRYYTDGVAYDPDSEFYRLIRDAESKTDTMCEVCGSMGFAVTPNGYWIETLCDIHYKEAKRASS